MVFSSLSREGKIGRWLTPQFLFTSGSIACSTFTHGFDVGAFNGALGLNSFNDQFGEVGPNGVSSIPTEWQSYLNAFVYIAFAIGVVLAAVLNERIGRRWTLMAASFWAVISLVIMVTATTREQLLAGRLCNFVYIGAEIVVLPLYQAEISPPAVRGFFVGTYQVILLFGNVIVLAIMRGTQELSGNKQWQIPLGLTIIFPTYVAIALFFSPDSPRWLLIKGREQEARESLQRLHGARTGGFDANLELDLIKEALATETEKGSWREIMRGSNKKRVFVVVFQYFFLQATGQSFASQYGAIFIRSLGGFNPIDMTLISSSIATVVGWLSIFFLADRVGRRRLLLIGPFLMGLTLFAQASLGVPENPTRGMQTGIVACMIIYTSFWMLGTGSVTFTVAAEVAPARLRDKAQMLGGIMNTVIQFAVNYSLSYAIAAIGSQIAYVYGSMCALQLVFVYLLVPECKGRSLEEVEHMYHIGVPARRFATYHDSTVAAILTDVENNKPVSTSQHEHRENVDKTET